MNDHPDGVLFDMEDVLLRPWARSDVELHMDGAQRAYAHLETLGCELPPFLHVFRLIFQGLEAARLGLVFGNLREMDIEEQVKGLLTRAVPDLGAEETARTLDAWFTPFHECFKPRPEAAAVLARLRDNGLHLHGGLNSPWPRRLVEGALGPLAEALDGLTISSSVGHRRPNLFFFVSALKAMGLHGPKVAYATAGGNGSLKAAEEIGLHSVIVLSPADHGDSACWGGSTLKALPGRLAGP
jgi:FMN phosphatase YigB (HAD superfamily)